MEETDSREAGLYANQSALKEDQLRSSSSIEFAIAHGLRNEIENRLKKSLPSKMSLPFALLCATMHVCSSSTEPFRLSLLFEKTAEEV